MDLKEGIDYKFKAVGTQAGVEILEGKYVDVSVFYSNVSVSEPTDIDGIEVPPHLSFNYDIEYYSTFSEDELHKEEFKNLVGNILMSIIINSQSKSEVPEETEFLEV